ncbi:MAG: DOPA 4,5-dioxygenase family protein [Myxococcota bacterium]
MKPIRNPDDTITGGIDIHVVFDEPDMSHASLLFEQFISFIEHTNIKHHRPLLFSSPVGPWPCPMWQVLLPDSPRLDADLGHCIRWLMINRGKLSVMIHPNTQEDNGRGGPREDHSHNTVWLGPPISLLLNTL